MVYNWEPDTQYNLGDVVVYEGVKYKIVQPHRSQSDWTPPATPALWSRLPQGYGDDHPQQHHTPPPQQPSYGGYGDSNDDKKWDEHHTQKVDIPHEEKKKSWFDLDEDRKRQLEIGGGLAAGAALLAGGFVAYKHHEKKNEEEKKANAWGTQNWVSEAQNRTQEYHAGNPRGPVQWLLVHGKNIPQNALRGGAESDGTPIFISRAFYEGSVQVGKAASHFNEGGVIGYGHEEISVPTFEVLVGDERSVHWVQQRGKVDLDELGARPVEAGREADGTPLFIAQGQIEGSTQPGKCSTRLSGAFIPYGGTEKEVKDYRVLCYNN